MGRRFVNLTDREWAELGPDDDSRRAEEIQAARDRLDALKSRLTDRQIDIMERYFWHGQKQQSIADDLEISQQAVAKHVKHIRGSL